MRPEVARSDGHLDADRIGDQKADDAAQPGYAPVQPNVSQAPTSMAASSASVMSRIRKVSMRTMAFNGGYVG